MDSTRPVVLATGVVLAIPSLRRMADGRDDLPNPSISLHNSPLINGIEWVGPPLLGGGKQERLLVENYARKLCAAAVPRNDR